MCDVVGEVVGAEEVGEKDGSEVVGEDVGSEVTGAAVGPSVGSGVGSFVGTMIIRVKDQLGMNVKNHDGCKPVDQTCERIYLQ